MKRIIWESEPHVKTSDLMGLREEMYEMEIADPQEFLTDEEVLEYYLSELNPSYLEDEQINLSIQLPGNIIAIADLGLWNGRKNGYKIMTDNLNSILQSHMNGPSEICIYGDSYNIFANEAHHDGTNHYLYRMLLPDKDVTPLLDAIWSGKEISKEMLNRYTRSLYPYVANVYGWPCRQKRYNSTK